MPVRDGKLPCKNPGLHETLVSCLTDPMGAAAKEHSLMDERRKFPRITSHFKLDVKPSSTGAGTAQNASQEGLLFEHDGPVELGAVLDLGLRVAGLSGQVDVRGKVVRCEKSGGGNQYLVAVQFLDVDDAAARSIKEMIEFF